MADGTGQAVQVAANGTLHRGQPGLGGTFDTLVGTFECGHQRLQAAGELCLLQREPDGRFDVHHQVLIARA